MNADNVISLPKLFRDKEEFKLFHGNHKQSYFLVALIYVGLVAAVVAAQQALAAASATIGPPWAALAFVAIGWGQFALSNGLHEALHRNFGNRRSDRWAAMLLAYPIGLTMSYRRVHDLHHRHVGTERDPDLPKYRSFPRTKSGLALRILASGSGAPALAQFLELTFKKTDRNGAGARALDELPRLAAVQAAIFGGFWAAFGSPIPYFVFWVLPLMTVAKFLTTLRVLCEHGSPDRSFVYRSLVGRSWQSWVLGSFDFNYHAEHHLYPSVPYAHLERLHRRHQDYRLAHSDYRPLEGRYERYEGSYLDLLVHWFRTLPWRERRSPERKSVAVGVVTCPACGRDDHALVARTVDFCYGTCDDEFDYVRCRPCGQIYLRNRPLVSELNVIYPPEYLSNDYREHLGGFISRLRDAFQRTKIDVLRRHLHGGDLVAEIGPGGGDYLDIVRRHGDPSWEVLGIDFSETAVATMRKRGLNAIQARIEEVEWRGRPAGAFVLHQLIEHVEEPRQVLRKCHHALREGGVMVLETPTTEAWDARLFPARYWAGWHAPRHWSVFDASTLSRLARQEGFEVAEVNYILSPFIVLHSLQYMLRERLGLDTLARVFDVDRILPLFLASALDRLLLALGLKTSNMQMVLRKPISSNVNG